MKKYFESIKERLRHELARSARGYLKSGLQLFYEERKSSYTCIQPAIGNLGIAVELMLKTFIISKNPFLLFCGLPVELRVLFSSPNEIPKSFNWRQYDIDLRSFAFKTIELDEAISIFYVYFPKHKQMLQSYFRFLSRTRNLSVHASLPSFQKYDLEKIAYLSLHVLELLENTKAFKYEGYYLTKKDKKFIESFDAERIERVRKKVEMAKEKSRKIEHETFIGTADEWELFTTDCPICNSEGMLSGYTEISGELDENGIQSPSLDFFADSFECSACGLVLDDVKELELAGMDTVYDRSVDLDRWYRDSETDYC